MTHRIRPGYLSSAALLFVACARNVPSTDRQVAPARPETAAVQPAPKSASGPAVAEAASAPERSVVLSGSVADSMRRAMRDVGATLGVTEDMLRGKAATVIRDSVLTEEEPSWDLDVLSYATHDQVSRYVSLFTGSARDRIQSRLQRGKVYEPMIRAKFRARGIPEDLYYLGLVESGYDPHAYSRAAAVGMWQFMSSTARGVGLRVDHWVDERRDPVKATDAAATFLNILYQQFGSYYLAAAAYNGGPGRVSRGLARFQDELQEVAGDDRFFALAEQSYLRSETRNYVPQLIAAALIGKTPQRYGMTINDSVPLFSYDSVHVSELTSLGAVANAIGRPATVVRDLNPHLLRGVTPPKSNSMVRVPTGMADMFDTAWAALGLEGRRSFDSVKAKKGETLTTIARAHGVTARSLTWYNPALSATRRIPAGRVVLVPAAHVIAASRDVPDPSIERWGSSRTSGGRVVHVVRRGESLGSIAKRYRTSVANLQRANGLKRTVVYPGQQIIVRSAPRRTSSSVARSRSARAKPAAKPKTSTARRAVANR